MKHVVLGLLREQRGYGYDLQQRLDRRFGFLRLSETAVYKLLNRLEDDGLIAQDGRRPVTQRRAAPPVLYAITERGTREFERWMGSPCSRAGSREELHVKIKLSEPTDLPQLIEMTLRDEQECIAELAALPQAHLDQLADAQGPWSEVAALLVDDAHVARLQVTIEWLQRARAVMQRRLAAGTGPRRLVR
ncbi:MAG TPA: PadR family transcriptional regulator [Conexibacter sp.]